MTAKGLEVLGHDVLLGYDIGCSFEGTILRSSLQDQFQSLSWRCCVDAFHGYTHSYDCQLKYHPNVIEGMGLEDLDTMERIFSSSNQLASVVRYASAFKCRVYIDMFFQQWDLEKYQNLALMLFNNYRQALAIINDDGPALHQTMEALGVTHADFDRWELEEREYVAKLGEENPWDTCAVMYVELLQEYRDIQ